MLYISIFDSRPADADHGLPTLGAGEESAQTRPPSPTLIIMINMNIIIEPVL